MKGKVKTFVQNTGSAWKKGSYSVGMIVLVIAIAVLVNMIAARLPEEVRHLDISDNRIYEISDTRKNPVLTTGSRPFWRNIHP